MKVHLRKRKQSKKGRISLYLEIYKGTITTPEGKTKANRDYEYLDLYLVPNPKTPADKEHNKETLELAESIKAKRMLAIKNGEYGFTDTFKKKTNFIDYFNDQMEERKESKGNYGNWDSALKHLQGYCGSGITFKDIDEKFCEGFRDYLKDTAKKKNGQPLSSNSVASYFNKFRACLKKSVKEKIISSNPATDVTIKKTEQNKREHLTLDEVKALAKTKCRYDVLKRAFLFACLTGLRWSDVHKLKWSEVSKVNGNWRITFNQKKTNGLQYLDIPEQSLKYIGERGEADDRVFTGLRYSSYFNVALSQWVLKAGITKHITFHCARHTFAVLQLSLGTDIYTVSKLLGHSEIKTTQIYADIIDQKRTEASTNTIPDINS